MKHYPVDHPLKEYDHLQNKGAKAIKHCNGNLWSILDMLADTGIDTLHPLDPIAGMDIGLVKPKHGDRICVVGHIDCGELLIFGTPAQVKQAVIDGIDKASTGGGHIVTSSNSIHSSVKPENYRAMIEAIKKHGKAAANLT